MLLLAVTENCTETPKVRRVVADTVRITTALVETDTSCAIAALKLLRMVCPRVVLASKSLVDSVDKVYVELRVGSVAAATRVKRNAARQPARRRALGGAGGG